MAIWDPPAEIGILLYPDVASATVHGLTDLFNVATTLARERCGPTAPILRVTHWRAEGEDEVVGCVFDTHPHLPHAPTAVIVPGSWQGQPKGWRASSPDRLARGTPRGRRDALLGLRRSVHSR